MTFFKHVGHLLFVLGFCSNAYTQHQTLLGLNLNGAVNLNTLKPSAGVSFEKQFTKHSGIETGVFYRTQRISGFIVTDAFSSYLSSIVIAQRHLNVPVLYKYYSGILNFSAGPAVDFYVGWKQKSVEPVSGIDSYDVDPEVKLGFLIKVSKFIPLSKQWILEPELRYSTVQYLGIGIAGKYRLR